jgi:hypothetical protein
VPRVLSSILDRYSLDDVSVEDPPLEDAIAEVFNQADEDESQNTPTPAQ